MKRALLLLPLLLCLSGCTLSNEAYYHQAQLYLGSGDFTSAASMFTQLGEYEDSADYALYCAALDALRNGNLPVARANMALLAPFKSSQRYLQYIDALALEQQGKLEEALAVFTMLGSFEDSLAHAESLRTAIPERDLANARALMGASRWEQALTTLEKLAGYGESERLAAQCRDSIARAAYDQAVRLYDEGQYQDALTAFEALGGLLDSPARARMCRGAMYAQLEEAYAAASLSNAQSLMDAYAEMEDYQASPLRLEALRQRFAVNLRLAGSTLPHARFGHDLLWRVMRTEGSHAHLLSQSGPVFTTVTDLSGAFSAEEEAAIIALEYPRLTIDLDLYAFTQGTGTPEDPYR